MIYADFESILVPRDNRKYNPDEAYTDKYQKHVTCNYGYKLMCVDDKFSEPFKWYLVEDAVYKFNNNMVKESKQCSDVMNGGFGIMLMYVAMLK